MHGDDAPAGPAPVDRKAIEDLLSEHVGDLRAFVRLRSGPMLRAMESQTDLVQSVCREVLEQRERFRFPAKDGFRHWLYTLAVRKIADRVEYYRAQKRDVDRVVPLDEGELGSVLQSYASFCTPTGVLRTREELQRIESAFDELSEPHREVIALHRLAKLPIATVAEHLGRSEAATRMLLLRALAHLSELLDDGR